MPQLSPRSQGRDQSPAHARRLPTWCWLDRSPGSSGHPLSLLEEASGPQGLAQLCGHDRLGMGTELTCGLGGRLGVARPRGSPRRMEGHPGSDPAEA